MHMAFQNMGKKKPSKLYIKSKEDGRFEALKLSEDELRLLTMKESAEYGRLLCKRDGFDLSSECCTCCLQAFVVGGYISNEELLNGPCELRRKKRDKEIDKMMHPK